MKQLLYFFLTIVVFSSCEDIIDLEVPMAKSLTVVDAWITDEPGKQQIRITKTIGYTDKNPTPIVSNATVVLTDLQNGNQYPFTFENGVYVHTPASSLDAIGVIGHAYKLTVSVEEGTFEAIDTIRPVPPIDSITYKFSSNAASSSGEEGYYVRFHGRDLPGQPDYYWVRGYKNSLNNPQGSSLPINGSYNENLADGNAFILPISESITRYDKPFKLGDKVIVRLASCTKKSHTFLSEVESQMGNSGLFSSILSNLKSNLINTDSNSNAILLGWFGTSAVSYKERIIQ
jgi:hypothetical protein